MIRSSSNHTPNTWLTGLVELNLNIMIAHSLTLMVDREVHNPILAIHFDLKGKLWEGFPKAVDVFRECVGIYGFVSRDVAEGLDVA